MLEGKYARRKIFSLIGLMSPKGPEWANMGRSLVRGMLNSAHGISDKDSSPQAQAKRRIRSFADLDGLEFLARIDVGKDTSGEDKNEIRVAVTPDHKDYATYMGPSRRTPAAPALRPAPTPRCRARARRAAGLGAVRGRPCSFAQATGVRRAQPARARRARRDPRRRADRRRQDHHAVVGGRQGARRGDAKACVLAHRDELTAQNQDKFQRVNPGLTTSVVDARQKSWAGSAVFAMVPTLARSANLSAMPALDLLVIDEVHHAAADTYQRIIERAYQRNPDLKLYGVTATPNRGDKRGLRSIFSNVADQIRIGELIAAGNLVRPAPS